MKKLYLEPSADIYAFKPSDIITASPITAIEGEGNVEYVNYNTLTDWTSND